MLKSIKKFFGFGDSAKTEVQAQSAPYKVPEPVATTPSPSVVETAPVQTTVSHDMGGSYVAEAEPAKTESAPAKPKRAPAKPKATATTAKPKAKAPAKTAKATATKAPVAKKPRATKPKAT